MYYIVKARYEKMFDNGAVKRVTEPYLVNALSVTEAETKAVAHLTTCIRGELEVKAINQSPISEVDYGECGTFYVAKVGYISIDEKTAQEKRTINQTLIGASDFATAYERFARLMQPCVSDWELISLAESPIVDCIAL